MTRGCIATVTGMYVALIQLYMFFWDEASLKANLRKMEKGTLIPNKYLIIYFTSNII